MLKNGKVHWFRITGDHEGMPEWQGRFACCDGQIFLSASPMIPEPIAMFLVGFDGTACIIDEGHLYVPAKWLAAAVPEMAGDLQEIERKHLQRIARMN